MTAPTRPVAPLQPLIAAVVASCADRGVAFGDGQRPPGDGTKPFIVGWFDAGTWTARSLRGGDGWSVVLLAHCAGLTAESSRFAVARLTAALYALHLTAVGGWTVLYPQQSPGPPMVVERDGDRDLFVHAVEWRLRLTPP